MTARRFRFKQADLARALRAARDAGLDVARAEIDAEGKIVIIYGKGDAPSAVVDEFAAWKARKNARVA